MDEDRWVTSLFSDAVQVCFERFFHEDPPNRFRRSIAGVT